MLVAACTVGSGFGSDLAAGFGSGSRLAVGSGLVFRTAAAAVATGWAAGWVAGFGAGRDFTMVEEENIVDAQIGYNFEDGQFEGLSVFLQIQNLTDQEFVTFYNGDPRQVRDWQNYGKTFLLGFNYKL